MANGGLITDYISFGAGAPTTPSLGNNATESAVYLRTGNNHLEAWNGSAWVDISASAGGVSWQWKSVSGTYTVLTSDVALEVDCTSANGVITLPTAASSTQRVALKKVNDAPNTYTVTINRAGSDTIDGGTSLVLAANNEVVELIADGTSAWLVVSAAATIGIAHDPILGSFSIDPVGSPTTLHDDLQNLQTRIALGERAAATFNFNYLLFNDGFCVGFDASGGAVTAQFQNDPNTLGHYLYVFKLDASANPVTISDPNPRNINAQATYILTQQWQGALFIGDAAGGWRTIVDVPGIGWNAVTNTYAANQADRYIAADGTTNAFTITMPDPTKVSNDITVKRIDSNAHSVVLGPFGSETFDGAGNYPIDTQWMCVTFRAQAGNWLLVSKV